jgi:hypothetical protein
MAVQNENAWHLDKKVPIGLILALLVQTVVITSWGTAKFDDINNRVANLEKSDEGQQTHEGRIIKLEEQFSYIRSDLAEIKLLLRRQIPNGGSPQ